MLYINRLACFLLAGVLLNGPSFATVSSVSTTTGAPTFPSVNTATGSVLPSQMRYCCASWVDYRAMVIVTNTGAGYFIGGSLNATEGSFYGGTFSSMKILPNVHPSGSSSADGRWLSCPAGYMAIGRVYLATDQDAPPSVFSPGLPPALPYRPASTRDAIYCAPVRNRCNWIVFNGTTPGLTSPSGGNFLHYYPSPRNLVTSAPGPVTIGSESYYDDYTSNAFGSYNNCTN